VADDVTTVILANDVDKRRGTSKNVPFDQGGARFGPHIDRARRQRTPSSTTEMENEHHDEAETSVAKRRR
jgi:hypothetical protein